MKKIIFAIAVLFFFIAISVYSQSKINKNSIKLLNDLKNVTNSLEKNDWEQSDIQLEKLLENTENVTNKWAVLVEHEEIDSIMISLNKGKVYANYREKEEALAELKEFEFMIDHIPRIYRLEIKNIF